MLKLYNIIGPGNVKILAPSLELAKNMYEKWSIINFGTFDNGVGIYEYNESGVIDKHKFWTQSYLEKNYNVLG